jgi:hypothetical protein
MPKTTCLMGTAAIALGLFVPLALAIEPGTTLVFRINEPIQVEAQDDQVYRGIVDQDVRENGRLSIPRGSSVELKVRVAPDNDLILDLDSVMVNGVPYAHRLVGEIVGAGTDAQVRGRAISVPRGAVLAFHIEGPRVIDPGVPLYARR